MPIKYELMKNTLGGKPQGYHAMVVNQKVHNREGFLDLLVARGTSLNRGDFESALSTIEEVMVQIAEDGEGLNCGIFTMHIDIKGSFPTLQSHPDPKKNHAVVNMVAGKKVKEGVSKAKLERVYASGLERRITAVIDKTTGTTNQILTASAPVQILGKELKIAPAPNKAPDNKEGIFAVSLTDGSETKFGLEITNMPGELVYMAPVLPAGSYKIEVRSYYSGSGLSKTLHTIESPTALTVS
ncbi:MAG: DNA-binding domain-containing protein [Spirochaetota bacterium]